jgi:transcriptional regulator with GAF, ATPase, and Fis domain
LLIYQEDDTAMAKVDQRMSTIAPTSLTVLLLGETGTGKEVFARKLHAESGRRGEYLAVHCGALPRDLIASELFGHVRGAFSGAAQARPGVIAAADGGTVLLDEIGDCPPEVQVALLRVLQEKRVRPVGSDRELPVQTRFVAATHRPLEAAVHDGSFRADLFARLAQTTIRLPPLRERKPELLELVNSLAAEVGAKLSWTVDAAELLLAWDWPFNVRELQSLVRAFVALRGARGPLEVGYLRENHPDLTRARSASNGDQRGQLGALPESAPFPDSNTEEVSLRVRLRGLLSEHAGNVSEVARALGKPRSQVYRWLKDQGVSAQRFRD